MLTPALTPKDDECIVDEIKGKDRFYFENSMKLAMEEGRRILTPQGIGVVVFAHKSTSGWEAQLQAMVDAGWMVTASWPIDTEMRSRLRAKESAALASSVHLVDRFLNNIAISHATEMVSSPYFHRKITGDSLISSNHLRILALSSSFE